MAANSKLAVSTHIVTVMAYMISSGDDRYVSPDGLVRSDVVASSVNTNPVIVRRILSQLAKSGVVVSYLGKQGGVKLARPADEISLLDIYRAVGDAPFFSMNPNQPNAKCPVSCRIKDVIQPVFDELSHTVKDKLASVTISQLIHALEL